MQTPRKIHTRIELHLWGVWLTTLVYIQFEESQQRYPSYEQLMLTWNYATHQPSAPPDPFLSSFCHTLQTSCILFGTNFDHLQTKHPPSLSLPFPPSSSVARAGMYCGASSVTYVALILSRCCLPELLQQRVSTALSTNYARRSWTLVV
jgi:hypothetical protein